MIRGMRDRALVFDLTRHVARLLENRLPTGIDRVGMEYIRRYGNRSRALIRWRDRWLFLSARDSEGIFQDILFPGPTSSLRIRAAVGKAYLGFGVGPAPGSVLLNVVHSGVNEPAYQGKIAGARLRAAYFLHDLIPLTHPEYNRLEEKKRHQGRLETMAASGELVILNSEFTRNAFEQWLGPDRSHRPRCIVAPLAPAQLGPRDSAAPISGAYFVVLGTIEPRKNHLLLLHIWRELAETLGASAPKLVVIGQRGWECEQAVNMLERCPGLRDCVIEMGRCEDEEIASWLAHARALLFPSFVEGFGLPLIEALAVGVPAIVSDIPVFHEIAGAVPEFLDPIDGMGWKRAILDYLSPDAPRRLAQRHRMKGFRVPTWDDHFALVDPEIEALFEVAPPS